VRTVLSTALLASAIGTGGLSLLQGGGSYPPLLPWLVIIGASFTTAAVATTIAVSTGVAPHEQGMAAALRQTAFQLGVAIGVAALLSAAATDTTALLAGPHPQSPAGALTAGYRLALAIAAALSALGAIVTVTTLRPLRSGQEQGKDSTQVQPGRRPGVRAVTGMERTGEPDPGTSSQAAIWALDCRNRTPA
jgi:predicted MFS family arabinose efflux permease